MSPINFEPTHDLDAMITLLGLPLANDEIVTAGRDDDGCEEKHQADEQAGVHGRQPWPSTLSLCDRPEKHEIAIVSQ